MISHTHCVAHAISKADQVTGRIVAITQTIAARIGERHDAALHVALESHTAAGAGDDAIVTQCELVIVAIIDRTVSPVVALTL